MAIKILMKHPQTGEVKTGFHGFSWTCLLFGGWPALFRRDWLSVAVWIAAVIINALWMSDITFFAWQLGMSGALGFTYNKWYTNQLRKKGFELAGSTAENEVAEKALGLVALATPKVA